MGDFPMMTDKGTFIINGTERVVVSPARALARRHLPAGRALPPPQPAKHQLVTGTIHPYRGEWIEFDVEQKPGKDVTAGTRVARKRRLSHLRPAARPRLRRGERARLPRALRRATSTSSRASGRRTASSRPPRTRRWSRSTSGPARASRRRSSRPSAYFRNAFFETRRYDLSRVGRYKLNRKLGPEIEQASSSCSASRRSTRPRARPAAC